jgi:hypothetical protein
MSIRLAAEFLVADGFPACGLCSGTGQRRQEGRVALAGVPVEVILVEGQDQGERVAVAHQERALGLDVAQHFVPRRVRGPGDRLHGGASGVESVVLARMRSTLTLRAVPHIS